LQFKIPGIGRVNKDLAGQLLYKLPKLLLLRTRILLIFFSFLFVGCASLFSRKQNLKVVTSPPGTKIYHDGELKGESPAFVEVSRHSTSVLNLEFPNGSKKNVELETKYRWSDSFGSNLMLLFYPPLSAIGIGTDFLTGKAWDYEALPILVGDGIPFRAVETPIKKIAIAPPTSDAYASSKQVGVALEGTTQLSYPKAKILKYEKTYSIFERYSWRYNQKTNSAALQDLYQELGVTHILDTQVEDPGDSKEIKVHQKLIDVFNGTEVAMEDVKFGRQTITYFDSSPLSKSFRWLIARAPNDFGLNAVSHATTIHSDDANPYSSEEIEGEGTFDFLSGISVRRIQGREGFKNWKLNFEWVPTVTISERHFKFKRETGNNLNEKKFQWISGYAGFGPQLTLHMPVGRLYLEIIPSYGASYITWDKDGSQSDLRGVFGLQSEFGYLFFVSERFNIRLFVSNTASDKGQWESVLSRATNESVTLLESSYNTAGLSVAYYLPELSHFAENWFY
jgi:hypothetical protein